MSVGKNLVWLYMQPMGAVHFLRKLVLELEWVNIDEGLISDYFMLIRSKSVVQLMESIRNKTGFALNEAQRKGEYHHSLHFK